MSIKRRLRWLGGTTLGVAGGATKTLADAAVAAGTLGTAGLTAISDLLTGKNNTKKVFDKGINLAQNINSGIDNGLTNLAFDEEDKQSIINGIKGGQISAAIVPLATGIAGGIKGATKLATKKLAKSGGKSGAEATQLIDNMLSKGGKIEAASEQPLNTAKARAEATMRKNMPALERDAAKAVNDAENMSLDDMFKLRKSQQNG